MSLTTAGTATTGNVATPRLSQILEVGRLLGIRLAPAPPHTDKLFQTTVPNRKHKKTRHQTEAYHKRIQKKWNKRFGTREQWHALVMDPGLLQFGTPTGRGPVEVFMPSFAYDKVRRAFSDRN